MSTLIFSKKPIWKEESPRTIAIFRALVLGDMLCTVPAFRALRKFFPSSKITLIGLPWAQDFVRRFNKYFDEFIEFPGYPGLPERKPEIARIPSFFQDVQQRHFDLALQMHGSGSFVNSIVMLFGAKISAGFYDREYCPNPEWFTPFPKQGHEVNIYLRLLEFLHIPLDGTRLEFPLTKQDEEEFQAIPEAKELMNQKYVCIHAGARLLTRRWFSDRFAQVANSLIENSWTVVLTGSQDEINLVNEVSRKIMGPHVNLAGKTTLGALGVLVKKASLLVSNDTGISHIAAALNTPSIIIVTGSDPKRWAPLNKGRHHTIFHDVPCRPCSYQTCPYELRCGKEVSVEEVMFKAEEILQERKVA
jgi:ADP-heptose:LPS heptosyltransferase